MYRLCVHSKIHSSFYTMGQRFLQQSVECRGSFRLNYRRSCGHLQLSTSYFGENIIIIIWQASLSQFEITVLSIFALLVYLKLDLVEVYGTLYKRNCTCTGTFLTYAQIPIPQRKCHKNSQLGWDYVISLFLINNNKNQFHLQLSLTLFDKNLINCFHCYCMGRRISIQLAINTSTIQEAGRICQKYQYVKNI